jgi:hypothetical protein
MTLDEKLQLLSDGQVMNPDGTVNEALARAGLGSVFSLVDPAKINQLQHAAVELQEGLIEAVAAIQPGQVRRRAGDHRRVRR